MAGQQRGDKTAKTQAPSSSNPHQSYLQGAGRTTGQMRRRTGGRFTGAGGDTRPRLTATLAPDSHQLLADLAERSGLPRSYVLDCSLALLAQHAAAVEPVLVELAEALRSEQLPVAELPAAAAALLRSAVGTSTAPAKAATAVSLPGPHRGGPLPHPLRPRGVALLLEQRGSDGTWRRGTYSAIGRELGVGRQTVQGWAQQLMTAEPPAAAEITRESQSEAEQLPDASRELALV